MVLTDYTTYAEVRAALGVEIEEVEDATLALAIYVDVLQLELEEIDTTLPATYTTIKALPSPSADQTRFLQAAHLFATYVVARHLTKTLPMFGPEEITDGKAALKRNLASLRQIIEAVAGEHARFRARLMQTFAVVNSSTAGAAPAKTYFAVSVPSVDPVVGEG